MDEKGGWNIGQLKKIPLPYNAFFSVAVAIILAFSGIAIGENLSRSPQTELCDVLTNQLPDTIPNIVVLRIRDDFGKPLSDSDQDRLGIKIESAISIFNMTDRFIADYGDLNHSSVPEAHILPVAYLSEMNLRTKYSLISNVHGAMCGNLILFTQTGDPEIDLRIIVHELGHFLGLSHERGTWMEPSASRGTPATDLFSERQKEILGHWDSIGAPYIPHWRWDDSQSHEP